MQLELNIDHTGSNIQYESKNTPLRFSDIFFQTVGNFLTIF